MDDPAVCLPKEYRSQANAVVALLRKEKKWSPAIFSIAKKEDVLHLLGETCRAAGSPEAAAQWLFQPLPQLDRQRPFDALCRGDLSAVWAILGPVLYD